MKKTVAIIYHRIDFDGICSYAIARTYLESKGYEVTPFPYTYGDDVPDVQILCTYDKVVIVDVTLPADDMKTLERAVSLAPDYDVIWIDHHSSNIEDAKTHGYSNLAGSRHIGKTAACELAWEYFNVEPAPFAVKLLSAYDTWNKGRFDWNKLTLPFQYAMRQKYAQRAEDFYTDYHRIIDSYDMVHKTIRIGQSILDYVRTTGTKGVGLYGFPVTVGGADGQKGLCCMTTDFGALAFEEHLRRSGLSIAICVNRFTDDVFNVAMYGIEGENTLDLARYMKEHYGGGGHFNAAGGRINYEQFLRLLTEKII